VQRLIDVFEATAVWWQHLRGEALRALTYARTTHLDGMAPVGDRAFIFVAVPVARTCSAARTANAAQELIDFSLQHGLEHLADLLTAEHLEGTQEIFFPTAANFG
jgi:hypothetical protein